MSELFSPSSTSSNGSGPGYLSASKTKLMLSMVDEYGDEISDGSFSSEGEGSAVSISTASHSDDDRNTDDDNHDDDESFIDDEESFGEEGDEDSFGEDDGDYSEGDGDSYYSDQDSRHDDEMYGDEESEFYDEEDGYDDSEARYQDDVEHSSSQSQEGRNDDMSKSSTSEIDIFHPEEGDHSHSFHSEGEGGVGGGDYYVSTSSDSDFSTGSASNSRDESDEEEIARNTKLNSSMSYDSPKQMVQRANSIQGRSDDTATRKEAEPSIKSPGSVRFNDERSIESGNKSLESGDRSTESHSNKKLYSRKLSPAEASSIMAAKKAAEKIAVTEPEAQQRQTSDSEESEMPGGEGDNPVSDLESGGSLSDESISSVEPSDDDSSSTESDPDDDDSENSGDALRLLSKMNPGAAKTLEKKKALEEKEKAEQQKRDEAVRKAKQNATPVTKKNKSPKSAAAGEKSKGISSKKKDGSTSPKYGSIKEMPTTKELHGESGGIPEESSGPTSSSPNNESVATASETDSSNTSSQQQQENTISRSKEVASEGVPNVQKSSLSSINQNTTKSSSESEARSVTTKMVFGDGSEEGFDDSVNDLDHRKIESSETHSNEDGITVQPATRKRSGGLAALYAAAKKGSATDQETANLENQSSSTTPGATSPKYNNKASEQPTSSKAKAKKSRKSEEKTPSTPSVKKSNKLWFEKSPGPLQNDAVATRNHKEDDDEEGTTINVGDKITNKSKAVEKNPSTPNGKAKKGTKGTTKSSTKEGKSTNETTPKSKAKTGSAVRGNAATTATLKTPDSKPPKSDPNVHKDGIWRPPEDALDDFKQHGVSETDDGESEASLNSSIGEIEAVPFSPTINKSDLSARKNLDELERVAPSEPDRLSPVVESPQRSDNDIEKSQTTKREGKTKNSPAVNVTFKESKSLYSDTDRMPLETPKRTKTTLSGKTNTPQTPKSAKKTPKTPKKSKTPKTPRKQKVPELPPLHEASSVGESDANGYMSSRIPSKASMEASDEFRSVPIEDGVKVSSRMETSSPAVRRSSSKETTPIGKSPGKSKGKIKNVRGGNTSSKSFDLTTYLRERNERQDRERAEKETMERQRMTVAGMREKRLQQAKRDRERRAVIKIQSAVRGFLVRNHDLIFPVRDVDDMIFPIRDPSYRRKPPRRSRSRSSSSSHNLEPPEDRSESSASISTILDIGGGKESRSSKDENASRSSLDSLENQPVKAKSFSGLRTLKKLIPRRRKSSINVLVDEKGKFIPRRRKSSDNVPVDDKGKSIPRRRKSSNNVLVDEKGKSTPRRNKSSNNVLVDDKGRFTKPSKSLSAEGKKKSSSSFDKSSYLREKREREMFEQQTKTVAEMRQERLQAAQRDRELREENVQMWSDDYGAMQPKTPVSDKAFVDRSGIPPVQSFEPATPGHSVMSGVTLDQFASPAPGDFRSLESSEEGDPKLSKKSSKGLKRFIPWKRSKKSYSGEKTPRQKTKEKVELRHVVTEKATRYLPEDESKNFDRDSYLRDRHYREVMEQQTKSVAQMRDERHLMIVRDRERREAVKIQAAARGYIVRKSLHFGKRRQKTDSSEKKSSSHATPRYSEEAATAIHDNHSVELSVSSKSASMDVIPTMPQPSASGFQSSWGSLRGLNDSRGSIHAIVDEEAAKREAEALEEYKKKYAELVALRETRINEMPTDYAEEEGVVIKSKVKGHIMSKLNKMLRKRKSSQKMDLRALGQSSGSLQVRFEGGSSDGHKNDRSHKGEKYRQMVAQQTEQERLEETCRRELEEKMNALESIREERRQLASKEMERQTSEVIRIPSSSKPASARKENNSSRVDSNRNIKGNIPSRSADQIIARDRTQEDWKAQREALMQKAKRRKQLKEEQRQAEIRNAEGEQVAKIQALVRGHLVRKILDFTAAASLESEDIPAPPDTAVAVRSVENAAPSVGDDIPPSISVETLNESPTKRSVPPSALDENLHEEWENSPPVNWEHVTPPTNWENVTPNNSMNTENKKDRKKKKKKTKKGKKAKKKTKEANQDDTDKTIRLASAAPNQTTAKSVNTPEQATPNTSSKTSAPPPPRIKPLEPDLEMDSWILPSRARSGSEDISVASSVSLSVYSKESTQTATVWRPPPGAFDGSYLNRSRGRVKTADYWDAVRDNYVNPGGEKQDDESWAPSTLPSPDIEPPSDHDVSSEKHQQVNGFPSWAPHSRNRAHPRKQRSLRKVPSAARQNDTDVNVTNAPPALLEVSEPSDSEDSWVPMPSKPTKGRSARIDFAGNMVPNAADKERSRRTSSSSQQIMSNGGMKRSKSSTLKSEQESISRNANVDNSTAETTEEGSAPLNVGISTSGEDAAPLRHVNVGIHAAVGAAEGRSKSRAQARRRNRRRGSASENKWWRRGALWFLIVVGAGAAVVAIVFLL